MPHVGPPISCSVPKPEIACGPSASIREPPADRGTPPLVLRPGRPRHSYGDQGVASAVTGGRVLVMDAIVAVEVRKPITL